METDKLGEMQFSDRGGTFLVSFFFIGQSGFLFLSGSEKKREQKGFSSRIIK